MLLSRRRFLELMGAAASLAAPGCRPSAEGEPEVVERPNVLFVLADQLRADACSLYGGRNIETPHIDALGRSGVVFDNALSTYPLCTPYRGMLVTGRLPSHSGIVINRVNASPRQNPHCLAHLFDAAGYATGFIGKWHLAAGARTPDGSFRRDGEAIRAYKRRNPEFEFVPPGPARLGFAHWEAYNYHTDYNAYWFYRDEPRKIHRPGYETDIVTDQAIEFMRDCARRRKPFLLVLAPHPPHPPFLPENAPADSLASIPETLFFSPNVPPDAPRRIHPLAIRCYLAMVRNLDDNVGRLMAFLDSSAIGARTVVVFTSDHGEMNGSHGFINKQQPYAESLDVPLVVRWPGAIPAGRRTNVLQTPVDHLTTLCGLAGIDPPAEADGTDLSPLLRGAEFQGRDAALIMNCVSNFAYFQSGTDYPEWRGLRTRRHTYARWLSGAEVLFDDREDPYQLRNLVGQSSAAPLLERLRGRLTALLAEAHDEFLPGTAYAAWYGEGRELVRTALGPVP